MTIKLLIMAALAIAGLALGTYVETKIVFSICLTLLAFCSSLFRSIPYLVDLGVLRSSVKELSHIKGLSNLKASDPISIITIVVIFPFILLVILGFSEAGLFAVDQGSQPLIVEQGDVSWFSKDALLGQIFGIVIMFFEFGAFFMFLRWVHCVEDAREFSELKDKIKGRYVIASLILLSVALLLALYGIVIHEL